MNPTPGDPKQDTELAAPTQRKRFSLSPAPTFLLIAWIFGTLYAVITPPFQVPDEFQHFYRSYQVSEGRLTSYRVGKQIGGYLPSSLREFGDQAWGTDSFDATAKANSRAIWSTRSIPLRPRTREFYYFANDSWHAPINFLAQGASIAVARHFGAGPMAVFYAGRLGNLLLWSLLVFFAIRLIPIMDWTVVLLALMPMSLAQAASLSPDATVNGVCFLFVAFVLRLATSETPLPASHLIALTILGAAVSLAKTAYFPLAILFLLIPAKRFSTPRRFWAAFAIFIVICIATLIAWSLCTFGTQTYSMPGVSPHDQALYMLHHPLAMAHMELGMLLAVPFITSIIGQLGWHTIRLWAPCAFAYWAVLFWSTQIGGWEKFRLSALQRLILALAAAGCWIAVFSLIYLTFTTVGGRSINGLQGRYMIPIVLPFLLIFYPSPRPRRRDPALIFTIFSIAFSIYTLLLLAHVFFI
jgi:uncharacterized membrane protein